MDANQKKTLFLLSCMVFAIGYSYYPTQSSKDKSNIVKNDHLPKPTQAIKPKQDHVVNSKPLQKHTQIQETSKPDIISDYAYTIWCEGRSDGYIGMLLVSDIIKNRVNSNLFPNTYYKVIHQKSKNGKHGQFSCWTGEVNKTGAYNRIYQVNNDLDKRMYNKAMKIAKDRYYNKESLPKMSKLGLFYHTIDIKPFWSKEKRFKKLGLVGKHIVYTTKRI